MIPATIFLYLFQAILWFAGWCFQLVPLRPYQVEWWEWCMEKFAADDSLTDCPPEKWTEAATAQVDTFLEDNGLVFVDD